MKNLQDWEACDIEKFIETLKDLFIRSVHNLVREAPGYEDSEAQAEKLEDLIHKAQSMEELSQLRKAYRQFVIYIDEIEEAIKKKLKDKEIPLIDEKDEYSELLENICSALAKGALLIMEDSNPLNAYFLNLKSKDFSTANQIAKAEFQKDILSFFFSKSNEIDIINRERRELKDIIYSLTKQISTLSLRSNTFNSNITQYAKKINEACELNQILRIKEMIMEETAQIQKENIEIINGLTKSQNRLTGASDKIGKLESELQKAKIKMMVDPLLNIFNRRAFDEKLVFQLERFDTLNEPFTLLIFDLDHFKNVNDTYGHPAGDIILKTVASISKETIRGDDFIGRYGGEEFVCIFENVHVDKAFKIAEKIRKNIASHEFIYKKKKVQVTVSIGISEVRKEDTVQKIILRADKALYEAKEKGRNQTVCSINFVS